MEQLTTDLIDRYGDLAIQYGLDLVGAILLLIVGWIIAGWMKRMVVRGLDQVEAIDRTVTGFLANLVRYLVLILVLVAVLAQFGVETASILAVLGTVGLAVGLALQGTLSNLAAGLLLLFLRPFKVGDYVDAEGIAGTVNEIGLFATQLTTYDGVYLVVPNGQISNRSILNYSRLPTRRLDIEIGIGYGDSIEDASAELMTLLKADKRILGDPEPEVMVTALGDSAVNLNMRFWCKAEDYWALKFDVTKAGKIKVEAAGFSIPFPQHDIHIIGDAATGAAKP